MKKRNFILFLGTLIALFLAAGLVTTALAAPAAPIDITLTQPDGSTFTARQWGDEWSNGFETLAGYTIIQDSANWWVYAQTSSEKILIPVLQGSESLRVGMLIPEGLAMHARPATLESMHPLSRQSFIQTPNTGTQPVLVLLAKFSDRSNTYSAAAFATSMFGASNSVKNYYLDASFNQLTLAAATESCGTANDGIVGWLDLGYNHPNTANTTDSRNQTIVKTALNLANSCVDYSIFDTNGDTYISNNELHIVVIVAGYERAYSNTSPSVWGHRWNLNSVTPPILDGKTLGDYFHNGGYSQFGEVHLDHQATIGIMVHEMGHDLTWPDLYDTDLSSEGVGKWSIMGAGNWNYTGTNYQGSTPAFPDAWLKWYQGWITPTVVNGTLTAASIPQAATNATAFLLRPNPGGVDWNFFQYSGTGEYFLVENRQLTGYDAGLPGCGLNIWHIDESVVNTNSANATESHPLVKMMEADGLNHLVLKTNRGDSGDPFPGSTTNRTFNYSSTPNSRLYSGGDSLVAVTSISNCAATMTANLTYTNLASYNFLPLLVRRSSTSQVLWSQAISGVDTGVYANQDFETSFDAYDIYIADDFIVPAGGWNIKEIFVPGGLWNATTPSLANANHLVFQIYTNNAGTPFGYPGGGGPLWSLSLLPANGQITLSTGLGGYLSNVKLTLTSPLNLVSGTYWLVFYPELTYSIGGQYGRHVSETTNGFDAQVINPGGGFVLPTVWTSIQNVNTWAMIQQDMAFEIRGNP